jgi:hypothetical protein
MDKGDVAVAVPPSIAGASSSGAKKGKRFEIKKWNAVSLWAWGKRPRPRPPMAPASRLLAFSCAI